MQVCTRSSLSFGMTTCCAFSSHFWPLPCVKPGFWHICSSILHQLSPAVLRNSTAYQHSSNATFYRCIGRGCAKVLQLRKYNRLAVTYECFQMWCRCGWLEGVQTGIGVSWHLSCLFDRWCVICRKMHSFSTINTFLRGKTYISRSQNALRHVF